MYDQYHCLKATTKHTMLISQDNNVLKMIMF